MTAIQWTDVTDNIIVAADGGWWCRKISDGCRNCYAAKLNQSPFFGGNQLAYSGEPPVLTLRTDIINGWRNQRKAKKHFVESMSDVFGEWVPRQWIWLYLDGMVRATKQTFQVLTKRSDVMLTQVLAWLADARGNCVPPNIWLGVSVENQACADQRIPNLLGIPATRFLSVEPLLEPVNLRGAFGDLEPRIHWVIVGGESGPGARPCDVEWIRSVVTQCKAFGVPVFVKQLGAKPYQRCANCGKHIGAHVPGGFVDACGPAHRELVAQMMRIRHSKGGDMAEWPADLQVREFPASR